jgi:hypothetical protein
VPPKKLTKDQIIALLMEGGVGIKYEGPPEEAAAAAPEPPPQPKYIDRWPELVNRLADLGYRVDSVRKATDAEEQRSHVRFVVLVTLVLLTALAKLLF